MSFRYVVYYSNARLLLFIPILKLSETLFCSMYKVEVWWFINLTSSIHASIAGLWQIEFHPFLRFFSGNRSIQQNYLQSLFLKMHTKAIFTSLLGFFFNETGGGTLRSKNHTDRRLKATKCYAVIWFIITDSLIRRDHALIVCL